MAPASGRQGSLRRCLYCTPRTRGFPLPRTARDIVAARADHMRELPSALNPETAEANAMRLVPTLVVLVVLSGCTAVRGQQSKPAISAGRLGGKVRGTVSGRSPLRANCSPSSRNTRRERPAGLKPTARLRRNSSSESGRCLQPTAPLWTFRSRKCGSRRMARVRLSAASLLSRPSTV
jgi:hypothetical protein